MSINSPVVDTTLFFCVELNRTGTESVNWTITLCASPRLCDNEQLMGLCGGTANEKSLRVVDFHTSIALVHCPE